MFFDFGFLTHQGHEFALGLVNGQIEAAAQFAIDLDDIGGRCIDEISRVNGRDRSIGERFFFSQLVPEFFCEVRSERIEDLDDSF